MGYALRNTPSFPQMAQQTHLLLSAIWRNVGFVSASACRLDVRVLLCNLHCHFLCRFQSIFHKLLMILVCVMRIVLMAGVCLLGANKVRSCLLHSGLGQAHKMLSRLCGVMHIHEFLLVIPPLSIVVL